MSSSDVCGADISLFFPVLRLEVWMFVFETSRVGCASGSDVRAQIVYG